MFRPLKGLLSGLVRNGDLTFVDHRGAAYRFGDGTGSPVCVRLTGKRVELELVFDPELAAGKAYMMGHLIIERGTLYDFLSLMMRGAAQSPLPLWTQSASLARRLTRRIAQYNPISRARRNVIQHYDIDPRMYELFLDSDRQYSCAYFADGTDLENAQLSKKRHIAAKLQLQPGQRILDIGSGWGGLALYLAQYGQGNVTGITLSAAQLEASRARAMAMNISVHVDFKPWDYREITGQFDRIVSVGMFEHVGITHYGEFFRAIARHLAPDGLGLIHTIGRLDRPAATNPFVARYIFPGGYIPALSEIMKSIESSGLLLTDVEVLRLHYAETLECWRERFAARRAEAVAIAGEEFCRMWEFYLAGSEAAFRYQGLVVFQLQLAKSLTTLPVMRDYIRDAERQLAFRDQGKPERPRLAS